MLIAKIIVVIPSVLMALFLKCFGLPAKTLKNKKTNPIIIITIIIIKVISSWNLRRPSSLHCGGHLLIRTSNCY